MRNHFHFDFASTGCNRQFEKALIYLNTVVNYSIWRHRNDIRYNFINYDLEEITKKMIRSIGARRHSDSYVIESYKIPYINELYEAVVCAVNHYPFDNG